MFCVDPQPGTGRFAHPFTVHGEDVPLRCNDGHARARAIPGASDSTILVVGAGVSRPFARISTDAIAHAIVVVAQDQLMRHTRTFVNVVFRAPLHIGSHGPGADSKIVAARLRRAGDLARSAARRRRVGGDAAFLPIFVERTPRAEHKGTFTAV